MIIIKKLIGGYLINNPNKLDLVNTEVFAECYVGH